MRDALLWLNAGLLVGYIFGWWACRRAAREFREAAYKLANTGDRAVAEISRLRALVAEVENGTFIVGSCHWCGRARDRGFPHAVDCPAFSASGVVR